jgi:Tol biopolymer transport system component
VTKGSVAVVLLLLTTSASTSAADRAVPTPDVYSIAADGTGQQNLTNTPDVAEDLLSLSPDGTRLAFVQDGWLVVSGTDGQGLRRLAPLSRDDNFATPPTWSPDGRQLAYVQSFECTGALCYRQELWVADAETGAARRLREGVVEPAWSPDGARFAYVRARLTTQAREPGYRENVVVARTDGTHRRTIAANASGPTWSPSGRLLAFSGPKLGNLIRSGPDGSGRRSLLPRPRRRDWIGDASHITWSPDRRHLAFTGFSLNAGDAVYAVRPSGRGLRRLGAANSDLPVSWAPNGKTLVWPHPRTQRLIVAAGDGRKTRQIRVAVQTYVREAVWSADGTRIFFVG